MIPCARSCVCPVVFGLLSRELTVAVDHNWSESAATTTSAAGIPVTIFPPLHRCVHRHYAIDTTNRRMVEFRHQMREAVPQIMPSRTSQ